MAQVEVAVVLLLLAVTGALTATLCPQQCQQCAQSRPVECTDDREYVPKPDCPTCCVVCAQKLGESCDDNQKPCANDLFCSTGKCQELPADLKASDPPIELLEYAAINSSAVRFLVRLPESSGESTTPVRVTSTRSAVGPWLPVPGAESRTNGRELELVASGLEGSIHLLRIEHGAQRSRAVRIHLPAPEITTTGLPIPAGTETCEHFGRLFAVSEGYLSTDCLQRCECISAGNFTCTATSNEAAAACRAAARKRGISGAETLEILDSGEESVSLKWRGPAGMVLQARALGTSGPWQRAERLTPDGNKEPVDVTFSSLQPFTTYEIRAVLPGAEDARSARLEDTPTAAIATTRAHAGQEAGFCVVLGRKIANGEEIPSPNGGCSENKCLCMPGQPPSCKPRCVLPFFRRGSISEDALCQEKPSPDDPCCVLLQCADNALEATEEHGHSDPCEQCADNAECHKSMIASMADEALCMCKDGFVGDPYDKKVGCKPTGAPGPNKMADRMDRCVFKNTTYMPGENFTEGCEHRCTCTSEAEIVCEPRCPSLPEKTESHCKLITDPKDECCRIHVCDFKPQDKSAILPSDVNGEMMCHYKNATYQRGIKFDDGCEKRCTCGESGEVFCNPRCPPPPSNNASDDKCVTVRDPHDNCCMLVLCDVTLADQDINKSNVANVDSSMDSENSTKRTEDVTMVPPNKRIAVNLIDTINATALRLEARLPGGEKWPTGTPRVAVFMRSLSGQWVKVPQMIAAPGSDGKLKLTVGGLEVGTAHLRVEHDDMRSEEIEIELPAPAAGTTCEYKGQTYKRDDEFHDGCDMYCACTKTGIQCATIECPTDFGLDVLDPHCLDWEAEPGFVATPPRCCPDMRCRDNGSCHYQGQRFDNFAEIPTKLSGCEQRCYCEFGNVSCSPACPPVPAIPPSTLQCPPQEARLSHLPGEDCCMYWLCPTPSSVPAGFPSRPPNAPFPPQQGNEISMQTPQVIGPRTVRLVFSVPSVFVGLHGRVEIRYTDDNRNEDSTTWKRASSATDEIIESPQLVHEVSGLQPATSYRVQVAVRLRDLHNIVVSPVTQFTTPPDSAGTQSTTLPPIIPIDAGLSIAGANSTWIRLAWRKFSEYELQFIDGVQIRYKEKDGKVYAATPLLHRLVDSYTLEDLKPGTEYEIAIYFIPFHGQNTELQAERSVQAITAPLQADPYGFNLALTVGQVKANSVELTWDGVPYPEDKYVNIYRAIYQSDLEVGKQELSSTFKLAKRDAPHRTIVVELKPSTRYRIWLEAYLTNGKIKKSDVRTFTTKPGSLLTAGASEQLSGKEERSDYYGALVAVAIVAALAVVGLMILLMILVRRQSAASAAITPRPAKAESAAYDNPTYKTCDDPTPAATNGATKHHNNATAPEEP